MQLETNRGDLSARDAVLSVVVPVYNERDVLLEFHRRLSAVLDSLDLASEVIFVNDGSTDGTLKIMQDLRGKDPRVAVMDLSRNYGKEIALSAGLDYADGDAVVVIDADLQHPPGVIPEMVAQWRAGYDVVYAKRVSRKGETWPKRVTSRLFYRFIRAVSHVEIPEDSGDFRLLSRRAVYSLRRLREQHRFMKGLFAWVGYPQKAVPYQSDSRHAGRSKWNYWRLWNLAVEGITSFTIAPLKISTYLGILTALGAFLYALHVIVTTLVFGEPVRGYPSLMVVILFLGGVQLITIGVIGEYLGRMFDESKRRPLYLLNSYDPSKVHDRSLKGKMAEKE